VRLIEAKKKINKKTKPFGLSLSKASVSTPTCGARFGIVASSDAD
jgi:hypothetical protein